MKSKPSSNGRRRKLRAIPAQMLPSEAIARAVRMVEIALENGNREQAKAAIDRLFAESHVVESIVHSSPVALLPLSYRTVSLLEHAGIITVGALIACTEKQLLAMPGCGEGAVQEVIEALDGIKCKLRSTVSLEFD